MRLSLDAHRYALARGASLAPERGDTLIEVLVATIMVALVAGATMTGYAQVAHMTSTQRHRVEADSLAELDQARLRGLTITQLAGSQGNRTASETIDGTTYTTTSSSQYVSGTTAVMSCTTGPTTTTADEVQITSTVTWSPGNDARLPVVVHGLVTPAEGGSMVITATDPSGAGLPGVTATPSGPTTVSPLATDANGCAIFGGLAGGSYTVAFSDPGYVDVNGNANPSQTKTVIPTETAGPVSVQMGQAATINATFSTKWNGNTVAATSDQFVATQNLMTPAFRVFGTDSTASNSTFSPTVTTGATMFPFTTAYLAFAGGCDDPLTPTSAQQSVIVSPGGDLLGHAPGAGDAGDGLERDLREPRLADRHEARRDGDRHRRGVRQRRGLPALAGPDRERRRARQPGPAVRQLHRVRRRPDLRHLRAQHGDRGEHELHLGQHRQHLPRFGRRRARGGQMSVALLRTACRPVSAASR